MSKKREKMEVTAIKIDPEERTKADFHASFKSIRSNAGELVIKELLKFRKKIPQKGLNNISKCMWRYSIGSRGATLPDRMDKLRWGMPYLPPQMVAMALTSPDFDREKARGLIVDILQLLADLRENLGTVTVVDPPAWWGEMITGKKRSFRITAVLLGLVQEVEFKVLEPL